MNLPLPRLDDRSYADLIEEARALIHGFAPQWTNHNPSDPGMTLIELFAWLTEMLLYRADQIPDRHRLVFLQLLNGPQWSPPAATEEAIQAAIRATVTDLRQRYRTVTVADYEELARMVAPEDIARVFCLPRRNLELTDEHERRRHRPGHISLIVVTSQSFRDRSRLPDENPALLERVRTFLEPRRLLTTRNHVVGPFFAPVSADILLAQRSDRVAEDLRQTVVQALEQFLDPLAGGTTRSGWPFGRDVYVSELYQLLEQVPGVDYVPDITLTSDWAEADERCVDVPVLYHANGDQIGLDLAEHHLPWACLEPNRIIIAESFASIRVTVRVTTTADAPPHELRRAIKTAIRWRFHPLYGGPDWANWRNQPRDVTVENLETVVLGLDLPRSNRDPRPLVELAGDAEILQYDAEKINVTGVRLRAGTLANLQVQVILDKPGV